MREKERSLVRVSDFRYKSRPPYFYSAKHINDSLKNLGFDYKGKILRKMTSEQLWANPLQVTSLSTIEGIINFLIEQVKYIKKTFSIAHGKEDTNIN